MRLLNRLVILVTAVTLYAFVGLTAAKADRPAPDLSAFTHHTAMVNGFRMHYAVGGEGPPVILLHGFPSTWYEWRYVMPELAKSHTVIVPDLRGLGDSGRPLTGYDKKTLASDITALADHLELGPVNILAHDWGVTIGYLFAASDPARVNSMVLVDGLMPGLGYEVALDASNGVQFWFTAFNIVPDFPEALISGREEIYLNYFYKTFSYDPTVFTVEDVEYYVRAYRQPGALRAGLAYYQSFFQDMEDVRAAAETKLEMPILAIGAAATVGQFMIDATMPIGVNVSGVVMPETGHFVPEEKPEELVRLALEFFEQN